MKTVKLCIASVLLASVAYAMPLNSSARSVIPGDLQQLISVDYRALRDSSTAMALKQQLLPDYLKQFEGSLKGIGIDANKDIDTLAVASFRTPKQGVKNVYIVSGAFNMKAVLKKMKLQNYKPKLYHDSSLYPADGGMVMTFLDDNTLLFGESTALRLALDVRNGEGQNIDTNSIMANMMSDVDASAVWSILDQLGTQNVMRSAMGDAAKVADYESVKKRLLGSRYTLDFSSGVNFDLDVVASDSITAATLSSLVKAGMLYKKMSATPIEKTAIDNTTIDSDSSDVKVHFKSNDQQFQSLMHSDLFAAVSH
ncbi:MAG TPA: hypothetical protein VKR60_03355 [Candidatus Sulfotelmatobacter sp.]|nr:hypothetical protein [Candidatus Sulfotelmatobacter sp.]